MQHIALQMSIPTYHCQQLEFTPSVDILFTVYLSPSLLLDNKKGPQRRLWCAAELLSSCKFARVLSHLHKNLHCIYIKLSLKMSRNHIFPDREAGPMIPSWSCSWFKRSSRRASGVPHHNPLLLAPTNRKPTNQPRCRMQLRIRTHSKLERIILSEFVYSETELEPPSNASYASFVFPKTASYSTLSSAVKRSNSWR